MEATSEFMSALGAWLGHWSFGETTDYLPNGRHWPVVRTLILFGAIFVTLVAILLLYGGNLQNTNIGPISIRSHVQTAPNYFKAPRDIVSSVLEGKTVRCTFYLSYLDNRGRTRLARISNKSFIFKLSALNKRLSFSRADLFGFWNPTHDQSLQDAFVESSLPTNVADKSFFVEVDRGDASLKNHLGDDEEIIALSAGVCAEICQAHRDLLKGSLGRFRRFYVRKNGTTRKSFKRAGAYLDLPDFAQDANLYMRMHFTPNPLTHPDPQVKTTAWLTVLTSVFALLIQWLYAGF
jgi:hypothetical protein